MNWKSLSEDEYYELYGFHANITGEVCGHAAVLFAKAIEERLKEKNKDLLALVESRKGTIQITNVIEHDDGTATVNLDMDAESHRGLVEFAFVEMLKRAIDNQKKDD